MSEATIIIAVGFSLSLIFTSIAVCKVIGDIIKHIKGER